MKIIYRISDARYPKEKPEYINNENCLRNFCFIFSKHIENIDVIADNCSAETLDMIRRYIPKKIHEVSVGHGAGTFNLALDMALKESDEEIIYFVENDYLHLPNSDKVIEEGFSLGFSFVSLYDHPDKYKEPGKGGNPYCSGGAENTRVYLTESCHWKITNSTTMTFASRVSTIKRTEDVMRKWTNGRHPHDFQMFLNLRDNKENLITPIPGYSTHGLVGYLSPLIDWTSQVEQSNHSAIESPKENKISKYKNLIENAFQNSQKNISKITLEIVEMEGMTGIKTRHFYNNLLNTDDARYLEIGTWKGSSVCSAMCGNEADVVCIDNWTEFGGPKNDFLKNFEKYKGKNNAIFIENDCFKIDVFTISLKFNIFLYDGNHTSDSHYKALIHYYECLDDVFIFIVDDWNWKEVRDATIESIKKLNLQMLYKKEIKTTNNDTHPSWGSKEQKEWHNGICVFVLQKYGS